MEIKNTLRKIAAGVITLVFIFSVINIPCAAYLNMYEYSKYTSGGVFTTVDSVRSKDSASPASSLVNDGPFAQEYKVRVLGCNGGRGQARNCMSYNGRMVDYFICNEGLLYSIDNLTREYGYGFARIEICPLGGSGTTTGKWSADTAQRFAEPEYVEYLDS